MSSYKTSPALMNLAVLVYSAIVGYPVMWYNIFLELGAWEWHEQPRVGTWL